NFPINEEVVVVVVEELAIAVEQVEDIEEELFKVEVPDSSEEAPVESLRTLILVSSQLLTSVEAFGVFEEAPPPSAALPSPAAPPSPSSFVFCSSTPSSSSSALISRTLFTEVTIPLFTGGNDRSGGSYMNL